MGGKPGGRHMVLLDEWEGFSRLVRSPVGGGGEGDLGALITSVNDGPINTAPKVQGEFERTAQP